MVSGQNQELTLQVSGPTEAWVQAVQAMQTASFHLQRCTASPANVPIWAKSFCAHMGPGRRWRPHGEASKRQWMVTTANLVTHYIFRQR